MLAPPPGPPPALAYRGCCAGYADGPVVRDVDLEVAPGECVALLGPNGAGKTTLVRAALGLARVHSGHLDVLGHPHDRLPAGAGLGYVPQRHTVATAVPATVAEVVAGGRLGGTGPLRRLLPARRRRDRAAVLDALDRVGLRGRARTPLAELSGGQQRRVLLARALAGAPRLLLLDEPTAGVDTAAARSVAAVLRESLDAGTAVVLVTHEAEALAGVLDRAVRVEGGCACELRRREVVAGG
ncbi:metal ABC transporter ATP-binding protein [Kineococcus arenarius]|uniref:metal ABC transporter ATP-binding protein n=1 Tax=Kineococcus sp. SYSU DK007 TaxID=3383128 RepID=UPI003D7C6ED2